MAVFICETCGATLKKQQIERHCFKCRNAWAFTCVECSNTYEGDAYKNHNQCMTEVEKYQGKWLERERQKKEHAKNQQKLDKLAKTKEDSKQKQDDNSPKPDKETELKKAEDKAEELTEKEKVAMRKFLKEGSEFRGLEKTAVAVLEKEKTKEMKLKKLAKQLTQIYKMSEDFDSDSDASEDEDSWLADKKKVKKSLKKSGKFQVDGKMIKLVATK